MSIDTHRNRFITPAMILAVSSGLAHAGVAPCVEAEQRLAVGEEPASVALGDLDGDLIRDMVVVNVADGTLSVGLGDGSLFGALSAIPLVGAPQRVALADMNGDGNPDAVVATRLVGALDRVLIYRGDGFGGFGAETSTPAGDGISGLAVADLDGDENLDVVTTDTFNDRVVVNWGNGDGTYEWTR